MRSLAVCDHMPSCSMHVSRSLQSGQCQCLSVTEKRWQNNVGYPGHLKVAQCVGDMLSVAGMLSVTR